MAAWRRLHVRWHHDTMLFEYDPRMLCLEQRSRAASPQVSPRRQSKGRVFRREMPALPVGRPDPVSLSFGFSYALLAVYLRLT